MSRFYQLKFFYRFFPLFLLLLLFLLPFNSPFNIHESVASYWYDEKYFHLQGVQEKDLLARPVMNEAIVQFNCHLFSNSTSNITLVIQPESEWNVSRVEVGIGQNITFNATNGVVRTPPDDTAAGFFVLVYLETEIAEVWGKVTTLIIYFGWEPAPGFLLSEVISLLLFVVIFRFRKKGKKTISEKVK